MLKKLLIKNYNRYLLNMIILVLAWGGMFRQSFNCDTLTHMLQPQADMRIMLEHGRYLVALQDYLLYQIGLSTTDHTGITALAEILLLALALCLVQICFERKLGLNDMITGQGVELRERLTWLGLTSLLFVNVLFAESFMFGECGLMFGMAYLLATLGVWCFSKKKYFSSFLFFFLSTMEYQAAVIYGAILLSAWIFVENQGKITGKTVREELLCGCLSIGSGLLNILSLHLLEGLGILAQAGRSVSWGNWREKLQICFRDFGQILMDSRGLLPEVWLPFLVLLTAAGIVLWKYVKEKRLEACGYFLLLAAAMFGMVYILPLVQHDTRTYPRFICLFYVAQAMLLLLAFWCSQKRMRVILCYISCGYLLVQILFCNIVVTNHMISNTLDETYAMMVYEKILDYEETTGQRVEKLAVVNDIDSPFSYNNVSYKTDQINERALGTVSNTLMNVVSGRSFQKVAMDEKVYQQYFSGKNWNYFDAAEQLIIIENTAYWAIF
ncbi:MAG: glucosyltransferase domain-containing protein [Lachnospiraceae bacterium]|nr:glucosyltransferase domain-containing protein [Lachnospiraceae bacterium]